MSATLEATQPAAHQEKKFGKTSRHVPHHTQKAKKWYPAEEEAQPKKVGLIQNGPSLPYALLCAED
jgi:large subunit ribosomal protein L6e